VFLPSSASVTKPQNKKKKKKVFKYVFWQFVFYFSLWFSRLLVFVVLKISYIRCPNFFLVSGICIIFFYTKLFWKNNVCMLVFQTKMLLFAVVHIKITFGNHNFFSFFCLFFLIKNSKTLLPVVLFFFVLQNALQFFCVKFLIETFFKSLFGLESPLRRNWTSFWLLL